MLIIIILYIAPIRYGHHVVTIGLVLLSNTYKSPRWAPQHRHWAVVTAVFVFKVAATVKRIALSGSGYLRVLHSLLSKCNQKNKVSLGLFLVERLRLLDLDHAPVLHQRGAPTRVPCVAIVRPRFHSVGTLVLFTHDVMGWDPYHHRL